MIKTGLYQDERLVREVKNLGWLLRNWKRVARIEVCVPFELQQIRFPLPHVLMIAYLEDEQHTYRCAWADESVCWNWLDRPVFRGLPLRWFGRNTACGGTQP